MSDELLYHYTTAGGFLGIIRDRFIRATNFSFLNDASEVEYGLKLIESVIDGIRAFPDQYPKDFEPDNTASLVRQFREMVEVYVSCFTTLCDDLSQWRAYGVAPGDRYCIGFHRSALGQLRPPRVPDEEPAAKPTISNPRLLELEYKEVSQRSAVLARIQNKNDGKVKHTLTNDLSVLATQFKNPAFAAEKEWRLAVSTIGTGCAIAEFVVADGRLKPFIRLRPDDSLRLPIKQVILLPSKAPERAMKAAMLALERYGYSSVDLSLSAIPFVD
jgi:hypothetical protein